MNSEEVLVAGAKRRSSVGEDKPPHGCMTIGVNRSVSFAFFVISSLAHLVSFATPYWYEKTYDDGEYASFGLWATCETAFLSTDVQCTKIHTGRPSQLSFEMRAIQTNMTLALISNVITFVLFIAWFRAGRGRGGIVYLTPAFNAFGGLTTVIATSVFGIYYSGDLTVLGWSFVLATISGGIQLLDGLIALFVVPFVRV